jgi:FMN phosphatase YigB (HAD superfamily)
MESSIRLFIELLFAILAIPTWELLLRDPVLRLRMSWKSARAWRTAFRGDDSCYFSKSSVQGGSTPDELPKRNFRDTDVFVESELVAVMKGVSKLSSDPNIDLAYPAENLIVIGSSRYNAYADRLQKYFEMKQEYVIDSYDAEPAKEIVKIVSEYGDEYGSSVDLKINRPKPDIDYGILFLAIAKNGKKILWISGIHGEGTIGVMKYLKHHPALLDQAAAVKRDNGLSWLVRVEYERRPAVEPSFDLVKNVELVGDPHQCSPRSSGQKPKALICDLGNVLMPFDRLRTYRAIGHLTGTAYNTVQQRIENSKLQDSYENGDLTNREFYTKVLTLFPGAAITYESFCELWGDIFWPNRNMVEALKKLSHEVSLVLLSNTNDLHFSSVNEHYPHVISLFEDRLVLSYREKVSKPSEAIFRRAVEKAGPNVRADDCIYVDDRAEYVKVAQALGMKGLVYYSHPQFVFWLRRHGLYVPQLATE